MNQILHLPRFAVARAPHQADALARPPDWGRYLPDVWGFVARRVPNTTHAEDITAETVAAAYASPPPKPTQDAENDFAKAWILGIARRKIADYHRNVRRRGESPLNAAVERADDSPSPDTQLLQTEATAQLQSVLQTLPDEQRDALLLKYADGLTIAEIAVVLNRTHAAANSLLQRARANAHSRGLSYFGETT